MTRPTARPAAKGAPGYTETMPVEEASARRARLLVSAALHTWGIEDLADSGVLVVDELVANSVQHTSCRLLRVRVTRVGAGRVRISVTDKSRTPPDMDRRPAEDAEEGRGLVLVEAMSECMGYATCTAGARPSGRSSASRNPQHVDPAAGRRQGGTRRE
ncbi:ATP-binding protein [Streptomyces sp. AC550_RSS872]|uniref:ATP-binding protein n=1 Tax=Streptomyces sp. AC550_RSS872 TaxID=2823689 RepID=UPI0027E585D3|nr:ATP-binding protein [Streptomyces sp. AC550_RSS872]